MFYGLRRRNSCICLGAGPIGNIFFSLHASPNEKTIDGLFKLKASVTIHGEFFGKQYSFDNVLETEQTWGLCTRFKNWTKGKE